MWDLTRSATSPSATAEGELESNHIGPAKKRFYFFLSKRLTSFKTFIYALTITTASCQYVFYLLFRPNVFTSKYAPYLNPVAMYLKYITRIVTDILVYSDKDSLQLNVTGIWTSSIQKPRWKQTTRALYFCIFN